MAEGQTQSVCERTNTLWWKSANGASVDVPIVKGNGVLRVVFHVGVFHCYGNGKVIDVNL